MKHIQGIRDLVDDYDVFLLDMWGVLHDGSAPYPGVLECIQKLRQANKQLIILSNSSKRQDHSLRMLTKLGFDPRADFQQPIVTSGEVAWNLLAGNIQDAWLEEHKSKEKNVFVLGSGDGDEEYCASCGWTVTNVEQARLILARGTFTVNDGSSVVHKNHDGTKAYDAALQRCLAQAAELQLPMLVANPDKVRPDKDRPPMPGHIGDLYETALRQQKRGGASSSSSDESSSAAAAAASESLVKRIGKPFADVYEMALRDILLAKESASSLLSRVVMIGDALETDVVGGERVGIDTAWVVFDGIHSPDLDKNDLEVSCQCVLDQFNARSGDTYAQGQQLAPTVVLPHFQW